MDTEKKKKTPAPEGEAGTTPAVPTDETVQATEKAPETANAKDQTVVYVGPSKKGLPAGTILKGLNETAKKIQEKDPLFKLMFPTPAEAGAVRREIKDGGLRRDVYSKLKETEI